ncbi:MAG TPA: multidrug efflux SMR transporter [Baekduia sp.]|nr:multidrug efflux SMR transporter [Baekduia sp.]
MLLSWILLALAIASEVAGTLALRAAGDGRPAAIAVVVVGYLASFVLLAQVLKRIEVSTAYAVWAGAGTALIGIIGVAALGEPASTLKVLSMALIIVGVVGLNLSGAH